MSLIKNKVWCLTEPRFRRVLMLCFPLSPSSSSLTGLNINGGGSTGFSMGGSSPYFLKWIRQSVHSRMFSRPPWCQSLEAVNTNSSSAELCLLNITLTGSAPGLAKHLMDMLRSKTFIHPCWGCFRIRSESDRNAIFTQQVRGFNEAKNRWVSVRLD